MKKQLFHCLKNQTQIRNGKRITPISVKPLFWHCNYESIAYYGSTHLKTSQIGRGEMKAHYTHLEVFNPTWPQSVFLNYVWLRDHCRCNDCYNHTTSQRKVDLLTIPLDIQPKNSSMEGDKLIITWPDEHKSEYPLNWLWKNSYIGFLNSESRNPTLWDKHSVGRIAQVDIKNYLDIEEGVHDVIKSLVDFGVGLVTNVPATLEDTEKVVKQISHVHHTMFGGMWNVTDEFVHHDTAYTHEALGAHNDNTYFNEAAGLQVFHCVHHDGDGGETLLVDGFRAAHNLKQSHPHSFHRLSTLPVESEYIEPGRHYFSVDPVIKLHPITKKIQQIRFNLYDRAPMRTLPSEQMAWLYEDLQLLSKKVKDPKGEWWFKLQPGMVLFIDNWRVLHGRAAYTGLRKLTGCYIGRADYMSKAKTLGII